MHNSILRRVNYQDWESIPADLREKCDRATLETIYQLTGTPTRRQPVLSDNPHLRQLQQELTPVLNDPQKRAELREATWRLINSKIKTIPCKN